MSVHGVKTKINNILCIGFKDSIAIKIHISKTSQRGDNWWGPLWCGVLSLVNTVAVCDESSLGRDTPFTQN